MALGGERESQSVRSQPSEAIGGTDGNDDDKGSKAKKKHCDKLYLKQKRKVLIAPS